MDQLENGTVVVQMQNEIVVVALEKITLFILVQNFLSWEKRKIYLLKISSLKKFNKKKIPVHACMYTKYTKTKDKYP